MVVPFMYNLPEHQEIIDALKKQNITEYLSGIISGWTDGRLVAETLKKTGFPVTTENLLKVMNNTNLSLAPLQGPAVWTPTDHVGPSYWRVYHWEGDKIVPVGPWIMTDVMGKDIKTVDALPGAK